jgi:hypothetical protein
MSLNTLPLFFDGRRYRLRGVTHEDLNGIVVILDALGIKESWKERNTKEILDNWNTVYYMFDDDLHTLLGVEVSAFSDTIIISMRGHKRLFERPWTFVELLCQAIMNPFVRSMHYDYFFRGVLAMGGFSRSSRMLIGPAVDEAALYYEKADWAGISLAPSTQAVLQNEWREMDSNLIVVYDVPQKPPGGLMWAVNWIPYDRDHECWNILHDKVIQYTTSEEYEKLRKYRNTLRFYTACSQLI